MHDSIYRLKHKGNRTKQSK